MVLLTIVAFILIFSLLVLVHEWGHFIMARRAGIKVEEFGMGLPPKARVFKKDKLGTEYTLNWIPFGGFVRLFGEDTHDPKVLKDPKSFASKSIWQRTQVIVAGVFMNFVLAWVIITIGMTIGMKPFLANQEDILKGVEDGIVKAQNVMYIHEIQPDSPADKIGLKSGDMIVDFNGYKEKELPAVSELPTLIKPEDTVIITMVRDGVEQTTMMTANEEGKFGFVVSNELFIQDVANVSYPFYIAPFLAVAEVGRLSILTVKMLGGVIVSLVANLTVPEGVAGPVGIAKMTHYYVQQGLMALAQFTALLSISLGVINIMPFPALDGGRFLFIVYELVTRRRANAKMEAVVHTIGFALLMLLILTITWHDIANLLK